MSFSPRIRAPLLSDDLKWLEISMNAFRRNQSSSYRISNQELYDGLAGAFAGLPCDDDFDPEAELAALGLDAAGVGARMRAMAEAEDSRSCVGPRGAAAGVGDNGGRGASDGRLGLAVRHRKGRGLFKKDRNWNAGCGMPMGAGLEFSPLTVPPRRPGSYCRETRANTRPCPECKPVKAFPRIVPGRDCSSSAFMACPGIAEVVSRSPGDMGDALASTFT